MQLLEPAQFQARNQRLFDTTSATLAGLLPGARIEHVGASAISGAWSKGDLDICVIVPAAQHAAAIELLSSNGWQVKRDTFRSHELCMMTSKTQKDVAIQLVAEHSKFLFFITFRNLLNADPVLVQRYNEIKMQNAASSSGQYRAAKNAFIEHVLGQTGPAARP